ncbi:hypothetical protein GQR58_011894 [Nymphon striatum]|nr:hypothetical protein GQR58_011894 [Nymphon striatum]
MEFTLCCPLEKGVPLDSPRAMFYLFRLYLYLADSGASLLRRHSVDPDRKKVIPSSSHNQRASVDGSAEQHTAFLYRNADGELDEFGGGGALLNIAPPSPPIILDMSQNQYIVDDSQLKFGRGGALVNIAPPPHPPRILDMSQNRYIVGYIYFQTCL